MAPSPISPDSRNRKEKNTPRHSTHEVTRADVSPVESSPEPPPLPAESKVAPDREEIALLAYSFWEKRVQAKIPGSADEDWYRAEQHLAK